MSGLNRIDPASYSDAPLQAAVIAGMDAADMHPEGYVAVLRGDAGASGRHIANLMGAPSIAESDTIIEPFEDVYGQLGDVVGNNLVQMTRVEVTMSLMSLTLENLKLIRPDTSFEEVMGADGITPVGVRMRRTGVRRPEHYLSNLVVVWSTSDMTVGGDRILHNVLNVNEDKEYSFSDDGVAFGVELTLRAHSDATDRDLETGLLLPAGAESKYGVALPTP